MLIGKLFTTLGDIIFPPHEDERIVRTLTDGAIHRLYCPFVADEWTALSSFKDIRVRALVHQAKYERDTEAQKLLANLIQRYLEDRARDEEMMWIPIPLSPARLRARGYNQVEMVLTHAGVPFMRDALIRTRDTEPQTSLSRDERLHNMKDAFRVVRPECITGRNVILLDDVVTTGATLRSAKDALRKYSPKSITLLALAH